MCSASLRIPFSLFSLDSQSSRCNILTNTSHKSLELFLLLVFAIFEKTIKKNKNGKDFNAINRLLDILFFFSLPTQKENHQLK